MRRADSRQLVTEMRLFDRRRALCFAAVNVLCGILGCDQREPIRAQALELPPIHLLDLDGQPFDLWTHKPGAVTVMLFTRTDCPISNQCAPEICRLHDMYRSRGVKFFLIYVDPSEPAAAIRRHLREYGYPCQALRDPEHTLVAYCHAMTTPEAVVFGKDRAMAYRGRVDDRYVHLGRPRAEPTSHDLADAIEATILDRPVANPRTKAVGCLIADLRD
jgi:hypothetical protein